MAQPVEIGGHLVGDGQPCFIAAEIGINHNGDLDIAKKLIDAAALGGCGAVKFQKRTVNVVYTTAELAKPRESPFGTTNGDLKRGLEFGQAEYADIDGYCSAKRLLWYASCWDEVSVRATRSRRLRSPTTACCATTGATAAPSSCRRG